MKYVGDDIWYMHVSLLHFVVYLYFMQCSIALLCLPFIQKVCRVFYLLTSFLAPCPCPCVCVVYLLFSSLFSVDIFAGRGTIVSVSTLDYSWRSSQTERCIYTVCGGFRYSLFLPSKWRAFIVMHTYMQNSTRKTLQKQYEHSNTASVIF